jgi:ATP-binding cassette, subfamily B, bacterial PglK
LPRFALETIAFGGILLIVLMKLGGDQEFGHIIPILALYSFSGYRLLPALQLVFAGITSVKFTIPALNVLYKDLKDYTESEVLGKIGRYEEIEKLQFTKLIEICNLTFAYPGRAIKILHQVDIVIEKNSMVGFVGSTGSGKTTIIDILIGLLDPDEGNLLVDGTIINRSNVERWQRNIGYVPQMIFLSDDTVTRNIAFGVPRDKIDMEAVKKAAHMANIDKFIEYELPEKYDTSIGEKGVRLSGGQRQRIGIARALYHDPDVLIFDEATSALDGETEAHIVESINSLASKKTIIIIAHRISTLRNCNNIYILEKGVVLGQGDYEKIKNYTNKNQVANKVTA